MTKPSKESMNTAVKLSSTLVRGPVTLEIAELIATVLKEGKRHLDAEKARSAKLAQALEKIHEWHWQHNSPAEIKGWADEALESYRAGDGK